MYIFQPTAVAEKVSLYEALLWIAFNMLPTANINLDTNTDYRQEKEDNDSFDLPLPGEMDWFFTERVCNKYGLPKSYVAELLNKGEELPLDYPPLPEARVSAAKTPKDMLELEQLQIEREEYDTLQHNQKPFTEAMEAALEIPKSQLLIELRKGNITAEGREILEALNKEVKPEDAQLGHEDWFELMDDWPDFSIIPAAEWTHQGVNWDESYLRYKQRHYCHVLIEFEALMTLFPVHEYEQISMRAINGIMLDESMNTPQQASQRQGRPAKYDWRLFTAEMARRHKNDALPRLQESCLYEMKDWCQTQWGHSPSITNLKTYISPFYAAKKSEKN